ncbi:unnamed protein product [Urochloa decumbens]|uniref:LisH domain-containing protein n=1 Tax=Urochloa decumbens TaxID=240449 RepID=A0ABC9HCD7_9POAL
MAPPKPTTPDAASNPKKKKVSAAQVAFLVDRYLADNGFHAALAAFRSDAAHLYSPHRAKPPPKGLIPLADILHDYIALKEGRVAIDSAMHAMHSLVSTYYAASSSSPPPPMMMMMPPLPPAANAAQPSSPPLVPPLFVAASSSPPQAQGTAGYASPVVHHYAHASTTLLVHNSSDMQSQPTKKRKHSKSAGKTTSASKKSCIATSSDTKGKAAASQPANDNLSVAHPTSAEHSATAKLPVQNSSVAKSLFRPPQPQPHHSSPCTPQQSHVIQDQDQPPAYPTQRPLPVPANAHTQQDIASSQCSIVSSKTLIVSPLKGGAYYAVERSYHVSSPLKSTTHKSTKREHVKGKLNFDNTDAPNEQQICDKTSTSSEEDKQDDFDIDFTSLFDGDFSFSELLLDLDLGTEGVHCQNPSTSAEVQRPEPVANSGYVTADPGLPDSMKLVAVDSTEDFNSQGATSVTSVRAITKRIKIVSPVKGRTAS